MASACVSIAAAAGGNNMIPRPNVVVKRRWPRAPYKYLAQERGPHSGRGQVVTFVFSVSKIGHDQPDTGPALQAAGSAVCACVRYALGRPYVEENMRNTECPPTKVTFCLMPSFAWLALFLQSI